MRVGLAGRRLANGTRDYQFTWLPDGPGIDAALAWRTGSHHIGKL